MAEKLTLKKFGIGNKQSRTAIKYRDFITKYVKNETVSFDIDSFSVVDVQKYADLLADFVYLNSVTLHSGRCPASLREKYKITLKKLEKSKASCKSAKLNNLWRLIRAQDSGDNNHNKTMKDKDAG